MMKKNYVIPAMLVLIVLAAIAAHYRSVSGTFQFDDERDILYRPEIAEGPVEAAKSSPFRALTYATYALNWKTGGGAPKSFHITNLLFHVLSSMFLFFVILRYLNPEDVRGKIASLIAAIGFAVHPACVASVDYISGRSGLISATAGLAMILVWQGNRFRGRWALLALIQAFALMGKEDAVVLPVILLLVGPTLLSGKRDSLYLDEPRGMSRLPMESRTFLSDRRAALFELIPSFAVAIIYGMVRLFAHPVVLAEQGRQVSFVSNALIQPYVYFRVLAAWLWPVGLSVDHHPASISGALDMRIWLCGFALIAVIILAAFMLRKSYKTPFVTAAWFILALAPGGAAPLADPIMENRWYFAMAGLTLACASAIKWIITNHPRICSISVSIWLICLLSIASDRSLIWTNPVSLWAESVRLYPSAGRPWTNYAQMRSREEHFQSSEFAVRVALSIEPNDAVAWNTLGLVMKETGRYSDAISAFDKAIFFSPRFAIPYTNRANVFIALGKFSNAEADYRHALRIAPTDPDANYGLAWILIQTNRKTEAIKHLKKVLQYNPNDPHARELLDKLIP